MIVEIQVLQCKDFWAFEVALEPRKRLYLKSLYKKVYYHDVENLSFQMELSGYEQTCILL